MFMTRELTKEQKRNYTTTQLPNDLIYENVLRRQPQVREFIRREFGNKCTIVEGWSRLHETKEGNVIFKTTEVYQEEPIISCDFDHHFAISSKDENLLKYIAWEVEKQLKEREHVQKSFKEGSTMLLDMTDTEFKAYVTNVFTDIQRRYNI